MLKKFIMGIRSSVVLNKFKSDYLVMEPLTEEQENQIDISGEVEDEMYFIKDGHRISAKDIFLYGQIDINNQDDLLLLKEYPIITPEINGAANIPSNYDYKTGYVYSDKDDIFKCHDTWNKINWFKFNHLLLGKPERVIIYRINKVYVPNNRSTRRCNYN